MEFPPPDRHNRISRTCSLFARCPFPLYRPAALLPAAELETHPTYKSPPAQKYIPRQSRDHINKAPSRVPFCLGKIVRSDRLGCGRKSGVKETAWSTTRLQPSAWWEGRSVWIGKAVPDNPQKADSAARVLAAKHPSKRDFLRKRRKAGAV